ncbi:hypothetical protein GCM10012285_61360 [Streptomyces kronopolitis]|uniref:Uncharacterized protein n=1 Tax=Streptomyces kronopolitis TaxID=1612435 RepID=A0ABQ2JZW7_9ACTN|nr:hypothetical protein GCM10012285_61360 [Streptomyces kronopolitis]
MLRHPFAFSRSGNTDQSPADVCQTVGELLPAGFGRASRRVARTAMTRAIVRWGVRA